MSFLLKWWVKHLLLDFHRQVAYMVKSAYQMSLQSISVFRNLHPAVVIAIITIKYFAKILHLSITDSYLRQFQTLEPEEQCKNLDSFLPIDSTAWFDLSEQSGWKGYVRHIVTPIDQADDVYT